MQQPHLDRDRAALEDKIEKFEERIEQLSKVLQRSTESGLRNKVKEVQEELCQRKFDLLVAQIHLSAVRSQLQLFEYNFRPTSAQLEAQMNAEKLMSPAGSGGGGAGGELPNGSMGTFSSLATGTSGASSGQGGVGATTDGSPFGTRRSPSSSGGLAASLGYRHRWIKAFKSLKETPGQQASR